MAKGMEMQWFPKSCLNCFKIPIGVMAKAMAMAVVSKIRLELLSQSSIIS
jgi:hypothetical protein